MFLHSRIKFRKIEVTCLGTGFCFLFRTFLFLVMPQFNFRIRYLHSGAEFTDLKLREELSLILMAFGLASNSDPDDNSLNTKLDGGSASVDIINCFTMEKFPSPLRFLSS